MIDGHMNGHFIYDTCMVHAKDKNFKDDDMGKRYIRCGQALFALTVINKKAKNLIKTDIQKKMSKTKKYAGYVNDIKRIVPIIKLLPIDANRNSPNKILKKIEKSLVQDEIKGMKSLLSEANQIYSEIIKILQSKAQDVTEIELLNQIMEMGKLPRDNQQLINEFIAILDELKPKLNELVVLNEKLINVYLDFLCENELPMKDSLRLIKLKNINKMLGKWYI